LIFQVFAKENCELCQKAQDVLSRAGVVPEVRYVEGTAATPENLADFAWFDWTDTPPLVVATDGDKIVGRWVAADIKDAWLPHVRRWLAEHQTA
jgi:hypothetical protein